VPEGDPAAMAAVIRSLAENPEAARATASRGLARANEAFSIDQMAALYARCLRLT